MVIMFAVMGIVFSVCELIARPFVHNYDKGFIFFSLNTWLKAPQEFLQGALAVYASFYLLMVSFVAVQFAFRYFTLVNPNIAEKFGGKGVFLWVVYCICSGFIYGGSVILFGGPDDYSDEYMREEVLQTYGLVVKELPRIEVVVYAADGTFRILNVLFLLIGGLDLVLQYSIIIYCGFRMHFIMEREFKTMSTQSKKLQKQFFRALVVQTIVPSILFVTPAAGVLLSPLLDIKMSVQSGWIYASLSLYPVIDSIAFMLLVSEYGRATRRLIRLIFPKTLPQPTTGSSTIPKT